MAVLADTSAVVDVWRHRRGLPRITELRRTLGAAPAITHQVVFEFARGGFRRKMTAEAIRFFLAPFQVLPTTDEIFANLTKLSIEIQKGMRELKGLLK